MALDASPAEELTVLTHNVPWYFKIPSAILYNAARTTNVFEINICQRNARLCWLFCTAPDDGLVPSCARTLPSDDQGRLSYMCATGTWTQERKGRRCDCPGRHWGRWRQASTSPVTTRAVTPTTIPFLCMVDTWWKPFYFLANTPGVCLNIKTVFPWIVIPMIKKRRSWFRLILVMGIPLSKAAFVLHWAFPISQVTPMRFWHSEAHCQVVKWTPLLTHNSHLYLNIFCWYVC